MIAPVAIGHICGKKGLTLRIMASSESVGAWEIEHSNARANGGTDRTEQSVCCLYLV